MTPQELAYYQQQQQEQEGGLLDFLGKAALAAGAVAGGIAGARYLRGRAPQQPQRRAPAQNYEAVRRVAATQMPENPAVTRSQAPPPPTVTQSSAPLSTGTTSDRIRRMDQLTREARAERPQGIQLVNLPEVRTVFDPWSGRQTILDPFGVGTVPPAQPISRSTAIQALPVGRATAEELQARQRLLEDPELIELIRNEQVEDALEEQRENRRQTRVVQGIDSKKKAQAKNILSANRAESQVTQQTPKDPTVFLKTTLENSGYIPAETEAQQATASAVSVQNNAAINAAEDQETGRVRAALQRNEDIPLDLVDELEEYSGTRAAMRNPDDAINTVASSLPDGLPVDQAEQTGRPNAQNFLQQETNSGVVAALLRNEVVLDLKNKQSFTVPLRALGIQDTDDALVQAARQHLLSKEIDTDFDYSVENARQAAQVQDRIQKAQELQNQADAVLNSIRTGEPQQQQQLTTEQFASEFNRKYKEELNENLRMVDNARQRRELLSTTPESVGEDIESLLMGESSVIDKNMRNRELRGGKPNIVGDISYQDIGGTFASADTGLRLKQRQGPEYEAKARLLNKLGTASDEELTNIITQGAQSQEHQDLKRLVLSQLPTRYAETRQLNLPVSASGLVADELDADLIKLASETLRIRAARNPEPSALQLNALERAKASINASQQNLQANRNVRPTVSPGPAQDLARSMETLRRGMIVEPSEQLPVIPSVQQLRTGYISEEPGEIGPILGAPDVYTGAAAEAAGPVIFTGKSKANTVLKTPPVTGSVSTSTGQYQTLNNPDVLGTVYNVAGTPANRAISAQVEANSQAFLRDAISGGLQLAKPVSPEPFKTPTQAPIRQLDLLEARQAPLQKPDLSLTGALGLTGPEASQRTGYAQYQPGRSVPGRTSPFIGEMSGGTVFPTPLPDINAASRRDVGTPAVSMNLTRRGEKSRYYSDDPAYPAYVTGIEPAPIGKLTQSPGLSRIGGLTEQVIQGAGGLPVIQATTQGQKIGYPRMTPLAKAVDMYGNEVTNIPKYGIDPGAEDWRNDLMRSAYRRGGPIRTYQG